MKTCTLAVFIFGCNQKLCITNLFTIKLHVYVSTTICDLFYFCNRIITYFHIERKVWVISTFAIINRNCSFCVLLYRNMCSISIQLKCCNRYVLTGSCLYNSFFSQIFHTYACIPARYVREHLKLICGVWFKAANRNTRVFSGIFEIPFSGSFIIHICLITIAAPGSLNGTFLKGKRNLIVCSCLFQILYHIRLNINWYRSINRFIHGICTNITFSTSFYCYKTFLVN